MTGAEFREIRERFRMNQTELGELMGAVQVSVSRWENSERVPSIPASFIRVLDISVQSGIRLENFVANKK